MQDLRSHQRGLNAMLRSPRLMIAGLVTAVVSLLMAAAPPAAAVDVSTPYPSIDVEAGEAVTFDLNLRSSGSERVSLSIARAPQGWQTIIRGGGSQISAVHVGPGSPPQVEVEVEVPGDANPGAHTVVVTADAPSGDDTLRLEVNVVKRQRGAFELTSEFPRLEGGSEDSFTFDVNLQNNTSQEATFALSTQGPPGWSIEASPSLESQAAAATVDAGGSATIQVEVDPPDNVPAGRHPIRLTARGEGTTLRTQLVGEITGSPELTLETASERLNASGAAGDTGEITLVARNQGAAPLQNVDVSASPPTGWEVSFEPSTLEVVRPGKATRVTAKVTPAGEAITGDYMVSIEASSEAASDSVDIRYTVETSGWWGLIGILVIAAAVLGLLWTFRRFGRR